VVCAVGATRIPGLRTSFRSSTTLAALRPWLENPLRAKVGQNLKFDMHILANHGIALAGMAHDTLLESYVYEVHQRHDLDALAQRCLGWKTISYDDVTGKGASRIEFSGVEIERATQYAAEDADCALAVHRRAVSEDRLGQETEAHLRNIELRCFRCCSK
jgi:DNA polymerase-1